MAAIALSACAATALAARIVPGRSIAGVAVGDERAVVERRAGPGVVVSRMPSPVQPGNRNLDTVQVAYRSRAIVAGFSSDEASTRASRVATRSRRHRTAAGIGVGSSRAALRRAYPRVSCGRLVCILGRRIPDGIVTRFTLRPRVVRVEVVRMMPRP